MATISYNHQARQQARRWPFAAILALLCGSVLTGVLFVGVSRLEQDRLVLAFTQRAHVREFALREGINNAIDGLRAVNQLFVSQPAVSHEEFRRFTRPLLERYPYVMAYDFKRFITADERATVEA